MIIQRLDRLLDLLLVIVLALMGTIVAVNVFCRFVLNFSIYWGDEAAQALLVWLTFLGAAVAVRERAHYAFNYLAMRARGGARLAFGVLGRLLAIVAILGLLYWSTRVAIGIRPWIMPAMGISRFWVYLAGPVGSAFMLVYAVRDLVLAIREHRLAPESAAAT